MNAFTSATAPRMVDAGPVPAPWRARFGPLAMVLALHALLLYFIYSGMLTRIVKVAVSDAVLVSFVAPPPEKTAPPAAPKMVPVARIELPALPQVAVPVVQLAQQPITTSVTQAEQPVEKDVAAAPVATVAPAPVSSGPRTVTSGVEYLQAPQAVYPMMSKRMGEQGRVILRILVGENGKPKQVLVQTSSGSARLDEAGRQAGLRALFKPYMEAGRPVAVYAIVPINFQLTS